MQYLYRYDMVPTHAQNITVHCLSKTHTHHTPYSEKSPLYGTLILTISTYNNRSTYHYSKMLCVVLRQQCNKQTSRQKATDLGLYFRMARNILTHFCIKMALSARHLILRDTGGNNNTLDKTFYNKTLQN